MNLDNAPLHFIDIITKYLHVRNAPLVQKLNPDFCKSVFQNRRHILYNSFKSKLSLKRNIGCFSRNVKKYILEDQIPCSFEIPFMCSLNFMSNFSPNARKKTVLYTIDLFLKHFPSDISIPLSFSIVRKSLTKFFYTKFYVDKTKLGYKGGIVEAKLANQFNMFNCSYFYIEIGLNHFYLGNAYIMCSFDKSLNSFHLRGSLTEDLDLSLKEGKECDSHWVIIRLNTDTPSYKNSMDPYMVKYMTSEYDAVKRDHELVRARATDAQRDYYENNSFCNPLSKKEISVLYNLESGSDSEDSSSEYSNV
jgi:hypothetical protein